MTNIPFLIDPNPTMEKSDMTDPSAFTSADQTELNHTHFANSDESILSGTWECAPCLEDIPAYPVHELMTVVSGKITLTHPDGTEGASEGRRQLLYLERRARCVGNHRNPAQDLYDRDLRASVALMSNVSFAEQTCNSPPAHPCLGSTLRVRG